MHTRNRSSARGRSRLGRSRSFLALGSVLGIGALFTLAAWSDSGTTSATFTTGKVDLSFDTPAGDIHGDPVAHSFTSLEMTSAGPGTGKVAPLRVNNSGTIDFTYGIAGAFTSASDAELAAALRFSVKSGIDPADCTGSQLPAGGVVLFSDVPASSAIFVDDRPLSAGAAESLCFAVSLPADAPNDAQDQAATVEFDFTATQS